MYLLLKSFYFLLQQVVELFLAMTTFPQNHMRPYVISSNFVVHLRHAGSRDWTPVSFFASVLFN